MTGAAAPTELAEEDAARASLYALIGRLFYDVPDAPLLSRIAQDSEQADTSTAFGAAWAAMGAACRKSDIAALAEEHQALFGGVGRALVTPYTSAYVTQSLHERHLLALRQHLALLGLSRTAAATDPEDHITGLCDAMRCLITSRAPDSVQNELFNKYIYVAIVSLCNKVIAAAQAQFYKVVARFTLAFLEVEREAFEMLE